MIIRQEHPEWQRLNRLYLQAHKPKEVEALGKRWLCIDDNGIYFISKEAPEGFDDRYEGSSFNR